MPVLELALRFWLLRGCTDSGKHKEVCQFWVGATARDLLYHPQFYPSYSACSPTWTDS